MESKNKHLTEKEACDYQRQGLRSGLITGGSNCKISTGDAVYVMVTGVNIES